jgi:hypothetical protein
MLAGRVDGSMLRAVVGVMPNMLATIEPKPFSNTGGRQPLSPFFLGNSTQLLAYRTVRD